LIFKKLFYNIYYVNMLALALASRNLNNTLIDRKKKIYNIKNEKDKNIKSLSIFKKLKYLRNRF
jgi:hypothetical protein